MPRHNPNKKSRQKQVDEWDIVGWLNFTKNEKVLTVSNSDGDLIGYINAKTFNKFVNGDIGGCPIKIPPEND